MTAFEAIAREDRIRRLERSVEQSRQLQYEVHKIAQRFAPLINDIYARSTFTITFRPGASPPHSAPVVYPPETEEMVARIREEAQKAITAHIEMFEQRRQGKGMPLG